MANRFPLIVDTSDENKIKELPSGDSLDLTGGGVQNASDIGTTNVTASEQVSAQIFKANGYTQAQRDSLSAANGMIIYNTDSNKFQGHANGVWVDLH